MIVQRLMAAVWIFTTAVALITTGVSRAAEPALQITGPSGNTLSLSIDDLKRMPQQSAKVEEPPGVFVEYQGVALHEVLKAAGPVADKGMRSAALRQYVLVQAADGYQAVFAMVETDPEFTDRLILLSYLRDAKLLPADVGPLRLVVPADKRHARWVRQLKRIDVKKAD